MVEEQSFIATIHQKTDPALFQFCLFSCFLSQVEPKKVSDALQDPSWVEAMQEELLQFKIHNVWTLVDFPKGVRPIGTKWVLKNKRDERGIVVRNKARLREDGIFLSQDKYIGDILKKFRFSDVRSLNTPMDKENPWGKDETGKYVELHLYKSMIGSLMYLTASRLNIMFATIVAASTTEAEYVAATSCYGQVLWIQNQLLDYG
nr:ribonuclease H-like domain, reverse transcriptase, RNA-dependent DNA polymerase [Tanacetum cinerariifolium]